MGMVVWWFAVINGMVMVVDRISGMMVIGTGGVDVYYNVASRHGVGLLT